MKTKIPVIMLISLFFALTFSSALRTSGTCDEIAHHIPSGYVLLAKHDFKMDTCVPPLSRQIIALPLKLFMKINLPCEKNEWRSDDRADFGRAFFYKYNSDPKKMILLARIPVMIMGILCGLLLFVWTSSLYGERAGLLGLFLYCLSPDMIAHAGFATTDMIATFFILLSLYAFWLFLSDPSLRNSAFSGCALGLAQLVKYNTFLLYAIFALLIVVESLTPRRSKKPFLIRNSCIIFVISILVIWAGYEFDLQPILKDVIRAQEKIELAKNVFSKLPAYPGDEKLENALIRAPLPLGAHLLGLMGVVRHVKEGHNKYFLGSWSEKGNPLYFLTAFLIKNPIPMLILFIMGFFTLARRKAGIAEMIILFTVIPYFVIASLGNLQLGTRYLLPLYPLCFMIACRSEKFLNRRLFKLVITALILWHISVTLFSWPDYIGYFNEGVGGSRNGYKYLRDSNVDWGQDLPALADYERKSNVKEVVLEYFGEADPLSYGVRYRKFKPEEFNKPESNVYAISVQYLENIRWTKDRRPTEIAGCSIFIYDLTKEGLE